MIGGDSIADNLLEYAPCALLLACRGVIQIKYRLTEKQIETIVNIIKQMKPSLIQDIHIGFAEGQGKIVFCVPDEEPIELDRNQISFINIEKIAPLLDEIEQGVWDNTIRTYIKELG